MHAVMKFRMCRRDRYECEVPRPLPLDGKYHMFCSRENKPSRVYKIGVHYDLQNSSMFPLEVNWNTYGTCVFQLMVYKVENITFKTKSLLGENSEKTFAFLWLGLFAPSRSEC